MAAVVLLVMATSSVWAHPAADAPEARATTASLDIGAEGITLCVASTLDGNAAIGLTKAVAVTSRWDVDAVVIAKPTADGQVALGFGASWKAFWLRNADGKEVLSWSPMAGMIQDITSGDDGVKARFYLGCKFTVRGLSSW